MNETQTEPRTVPALALMPTSKVVVHRERQGDLLDAEPGPQLRPGTDRAAGSHPELAGWRSPAQLSRRVRELSMSALPGVVLPYMSAEWTRRADAMAATGPSGEHWMVAAVWGYPSQLWSVRNPQTGLYS